MSVSTCFENDFLTTLINFLIRRHEKKSTWCSQKYSTRFIFYYYRGFNFKIFNLNVTILLYYIICYMYIPQFIFMFLSILRYIYPHIYNVNSMFLLLWFCFIYRYVYEDTSSTACIEWPPKIDRFVQFSNELKNYLDRWFFRVLTTATTTTTEFFFYSFWKLGYKI